MKIKNAFKYIIGIFFTCYGIYYGFHSIHILAKLFGVYCYIVQAQYSIDDMMFLRNLFLNSTMSILELAYSITCLRIGLSRKKWRFILTCGIIGSILYLLSFFEAVFFFESVDSSMLFHIFLFMLFPISIIAFAVYCKVYENCNTKTTYYPITSFIKATVLVFKKSMHNIKLNKVSWINPEDSKERDASSPKHD